MRFSELSRHAAQLDDGHVVIRASFDSRDFLVRAFPDTFSVPSRRELPGGA
jgi:hypothetical protein